MSDVIARPEDVEAFIDARGISQAQLSDLEHYRVMLAAANRHMNLVGASTLGDFWRRHFLDSAQLVALAPDARTWADLGSGAGLPGLVLAILLKPCAGARVHLVDSMAKRCRFLSEVVRALALPAEVHCERAERLALNVDVVTARACAPLTRLLGFAHPSMGGSSRALFLKGAEVDSEIAEARKSWRFAVTTHASLSDPRGRVVEISELASVN